MDFKLTAKYKPMGDQPRAISQLVEAMRIGERYKVLLGVTGSGKTFTMANVVAELNRPTLVLCHNKTLAAQLYQEFKNFFPDNAVEYYVSYYDYYQPEAYIPTTGTYIEKDLSINDEIEKMRLSTTSTLLSGRRDVLVVASVSCIYGIGNPDDYKATSVVARVGDKIHQLALMMKLVEALYTRTERELERATFRLNGTSIDVMSAYGERCYRITITDNRIDEVAEIERESGVTISRLDSVTISPANLFVTTKERIAQAINEITLDMGTQVREFESRGMEIEAERLKQRVEHDLEMIKELGYCSGIENYSRYFDRRKPGEPPFCLLNYFPKDFVMFIDESHVTIPQIGAMSGGDKARKVSLIDNGFRLEAARDNRPLTFDEFTKITSQTICVSATPGDWEISHSRGVAEQLVRPTGLLDPPMKLRSVTQPMDDMLEEIRKRVERQEKVMVCTVTKKMSEEVSRYLTRVDVRNRFIHSDLDTLERVEVLEELRADQFDVLVGVNLLREGLDLPEVSLVVIFDADKQGFLRNSRALTQMVGRAARHSRGTALLYGSTVPKSISVSLRESNRHRFLQARYNLEHKQQPRMAQRSATADQKSDLLSRRPTEETLKMAPRQEEVHYITKKYSAKMDNQLVAEPSTKGRYKGAKSGVAQYPIREAGTNTLVAEATQSLDDQIAEAKSLMEDAAKRCDFLEAIKHRDRMNELTKLRDSR